MPRRLNCRQAKLIKVYLENTKNGSQTLDGWEIAKLAGYSGTKTTLRAMASNTLAKPHIRAIIDKHLADDRERVMEKLDHNRDIAIEKLRQDHANLDIKAANGDVGAVQARTAIIRELDAISNLHSQEIKHTETDIKRTEPKEEESILKGRLALLESMRKVPDCIQRN
jgi:hypothetical protein